MGDVHKCNEGPSEYGIVVGTVPPFELSVTLKLPLQQMAFRRPLMVSWAVS